MPGPRNQRKKKQAQRKKHQHTHSKSLEDDITQQSPTPTDTESEVGSPTHNISTQSPPTNQEIHDTPRPGSNQVAAAQEAQVDEPRASGHEAYYPNPPSEHLDEPPIPPSLLRIPPIHDPGDGPRVKDVPAFLASRFAVPPSLDDPLCAEFADEAVLQMLCTILPEETAMIMWHNKSRRSARICPACHRLYRLGDVLPDHLADEETREQKEPQTSPYRAKEQELSGLCSPICFILASYNYPGAIRSTWGRVAEELDDATWDLLDAPGQTNDMGLGMLLKMTRCHDLGLGQLFFPDMELESDSTCNDTDSELEEDKNAKWADEEVTVKMEKFGLGVEDVEDVIAPVCA
ncbi:hypothetical protein C8Q80DRAFT_1273285 [Daedaleopsis nitida]|nr:hypothetical protein C8Q80DRAFT_1273285 [Daedaleopsis nitida]